MDHDYYDAEHLRLLSIFHYVLAGLAAVFGTFPIIHLVMGVLIIQGAFPQQPGQPEMPREFGWVFVGFAAFFIFMGWTLAVLLVIAGRLLARRRGYTFCLVVAGLSCLFMPLGTVLGVFTIIVLMRPGVKASFGRPADVPTAEPWEG